jgi:hypothetical protein
MMPDAKVLLDGQLIELSFSAARAMVQQLAHDSEHHSREEAERAARAGWVMMQFAGDRRYGVFSNLYLKFGVTPQRGKRMRRYAEQFINPSTGTFDGEAWRADRAGRNKAARKKDPTPDVRENPNEKDSQSHFVRQDPNKQDDTAGGVGGRFADPFEEAMNNLPPPRSRGPKPHMMPGYVPPAERPAGCVGATQPELPWHLAESARTLADRAAEFEQAVQRGEVDADYAHSIQARIDGLLTDLAAAKAGAL